AGPSIGNSWALALAGVLRPGSGDTGSIAPGSAATGVAGDMRISVVLTTYNSPLWLEKVLCGYEQQTHGDFEVVIGDDGSTRETTELIERLRAGTRLDIQHVWQRDDGFRKCRILN